MKSGDIVFAKYHNKWHPAEVLLVTKKTKRFFGIPYITKYLALVQFDLQQKVCVDGKYVWEPFEVIEEIPVDELRPTE